MSSCDPLLGPLNLNSNLSWNSDITSPLVLVVISHNTHSQLHSLMYLEMIPSNEIDRRAKKFLDVQQFI